MLALLKEQRDLTPEEPQDLATSSCFLTPCAPGSSRFSSHAHSCGLDTEHRLATSLAPTLRSSVIRRCPWDHLPWCLDMESLWGPPVSRILASGLNTILSNSMLVLILRDFNIHRTFLQHPAISAPSGPLLQGACGLPLRSLASWPTAQTPPHPVCRRHGAQPLQTGGDKPNPTRLVTHSLEGCLFTSDSGIWRPRGRWLEIRWRKAKRGDNPEKRLETKSVSGRLGSWGSGHLLGHRAGPGPGEAVEGSRMVRRQDQGRLTLGVTASK